MSKPHTTISADDVLDGLLRSAERLEKRVAEGTDVEALRAELDVIRQEIREVRQAKGTGRATYEGERAGDGTLRFQILDGSWWKIRPNGKVTRDG